VNDDDPTFASVRLPVGSLKAMLSGCTPPTHSDGRRATAFTTAWDMLMHRRVRQPRTSCAVQAVLRSESVESLIEPAFDLAIEAADMCSPDGDREKPVSDLADRAAEPGGRRSHAAA
jgi:aminopeptidase N